MTRLEAAEQALIAKDRMIAALVARARAGTQAASPLAAMKENAALQQIVAQKTRELAEQNGRLSQEIETRKTAEEAMRRLQSQQAAILDAAAYGIHGLDAEGRIIFENPAACRMLGWEPKALIGQVAHAMLHHTRPDGSVYPVEQCPIRATLREGRPVKVSDEVFWRKDGSSFPVEYTVTPLRGERGEITGAVVVFVDITQRRAAEIALFESNEMLRVVLDTIPVRVFWKNLDLVYLGCNSSFARDTGLASPAALVGKDDRELSWADRAEAYRADDRLVIRTGQPRLNFEERLTARGGSQLWLRTSKVPLRDVTGHIKGVLGTYEDITAHKEAEANKREEDARYQRQRAALIAVAGDDSTRGENLSDKLRRLTETSAATLGVARAGVWRYDADRTAIRCLDLYEANESRHTADMELSATGFPRYFQALRQQQVIAADDAQIDPHTAEFADAYLRPKGITSMLDAPIYLGGVAEGVLCHEHIGPARKWTADEQTFAIALANQVSLALEAAERQRAEAALRESETRIRAITDAAQDAILSMDPDGRISYWNPAAERILGYTRDEALGKNLHELLAPARYHAAHRAALPTFLRSGQGEAVGKLVDLEARRKDGQEVPIQLSLSGVRIGGAWHAVGILRDITDRKEAEAAVLRARDAALESARLKSEFLANMSHEIRTPMNGVIGMLNLLADTPLEPQQRDFAETARLSAESLLTVLNDILDFSKIEAGKLVMEETSFNLHELIESTLELLAERGQAKGLELVAEVSQHSPVLLRGDPTRLRQVLLNLLGNAVKFTECGEVVIHARTELVAGTALRAYFEVRDTGIGIAQEAQGRLFQAFTQADGSTTRKYGGTGLGLVISRRIVELMHGEMGLRSQPGQGSTFWFSVPLQQDNSVPTPPRRCSLTGQRVLIVDDNATNRTVLHHQLAAAHVNDAEARDGIEALRLLRAAAAAGRPYPLVLLDLQMPGMDGLEVARAIKADPAISSARLILLTSLGVHIAEADRRAVGVDECLFKPVRHARLLDSLERSLAQVSPVPATTAALAPVPVVSPLRILLAEDNLVNQKVALGQLRRLGYAADVVVNGREAVAAQERAPYDVILMDCQMPEMEGYEATRLIRRDETASTNRGHRAYIIAMTAHALEGDREKCLAAGMDDYLSKPVKVPDLGAALTRATEALRTATRP